MLHGGNVIRSGITGNNNSEIMEFHLNLESNPEFTAAISVACARAVFRLNKEGKTGAMTILDLDDRSEERRVGKMYASSDLSSINLFYK